MQVQSLGQEDTLEEGMATHSSIPIWSIPRTEEPGRLESIGSQRVKHNWSNLAQRPRVKAKGQPVRQLLHFIPNVTYLFWTWEGQVVLLYSMHLDSLEAVLSHP